MEVVWRSCQVSCSYETYAFLHRPRSQSASAVVNKSQLHIISGYSALSEDRGIPSMQTVNLGGPGKDESIEMDRYSSRLAAAVTLSSGEVLITGGKGKEQEAFLLSGLAHKTWLQRADMLTPRIGHGAVSLQLYGKETVMVAGGWDRLGRTLSSVEIFLVGENVWQEFIAMPSPRADFSLQARPVPTSDYLKDH